jgi:SecD/SecF fusion protein
LRDKGIAQDVSVTEVKSETLGDGRIYRVDTSLLEVDPKTASSEEVGSAIDQVQHALQEEFRDGQETLLQTRSLRYSAPTAFGAAGTTPPAAPELPTLEDSPAGPGDSQGSVGPPSAIDGTVARPLDADNLLAYGGETLLAQADLATGDPQSLPAASPQSAASQTDVSSLRSESELTFAQKINAETLQDLIKEQAAALKLSEPDVELTSPEDNWEEGSSQGHRAWHLGLSSSPAQAEQILSALKVRLDDTPVWLSANQIGSAVAGDKTRLAIAAVLGSLIGIIAYIWIRFQHVTYGLAAVVALVHDVVITVGAIAASYWLKDVLGFLMIDEFKISLPVVAALLTIIGYSLNDTIVVFDRIREVKGKSPHLTPQMINSSINQTLSRTILTSFTTLLAVAVLYAIGGQGIHAFAFSLIVGIVVGTYSSIFVASPILLWMSQSGEATPAAAERVTA